MATEDSVLDPDLASSSLPTSLKSIPRNNFVKFTKTLFCGIMSSLSTFPNNTPIRPDAVVEATNNLFTSTISSLSTVLNNRPLHPDTPAAERTENLFRDVCGTLKVLVSGLIDTYNASGIMTQELRDLELGDIDQEARNDNHAPAPDAGGGQGSVETPSTRFHLICSWMTARIVALLSLIVVPGLVLGVVTGQLPWGIALGGAIATVLSFFVSLYK